MSGVRWATRLTGAALMSLPACQGASRDQPEAASPRRAADWSDAEVVAFIRGTSAGIAATAETAGVRVRKPAVRSHALRIAARHRMLVTAADSLIAIGVVTVVPPPDTTIIQAHRRAFGRIRTQPNLELAWARSLRTVLLAAGDTLDQTSVPARPRGVARLLQKARDVTHDGASITGALVRTLDAAQRRAAPRTEGTSK